MEKRFPIVWQWLLGLILTLSVYAQEIATNPSPAPFAIQPDDVVLEKLRTRLGSQNHAVYRKFRRVGNRTIEFESFIVCEGELKLFSRIMAEPHLYRDWVLKDINIKPGGGSFFIRLSDIAPHSSEPEAITLFFNFNLPLFKRPLQRSFRVKSHVAAKSFMVEAETIYQAKGPVGSAHGFLKAFQSEKSPQHLWMYLNGRSILRSALLYEAMPESILNRESGHRLETIVANYQAEENRRRITDEKSTRAATSVGK